VLFTGVEALAAFARRRGLRSETQAGKGSLPYDHAQCMSAVGRQGLAAKPVGAQADVIIGVGRGIRISRTR
jgi:3D-(3,5/4)-trihydroxycyclohexane-1,2-dione acylhydrolase (decyclizing)